jgi:hypothetical protein
VQHMVAIIAMILVLGPIASWVFTLTPLGRALVERMKGVSAGSEEALLDIQDEMERLNEHITSQDQRVEELHYRLDFTERLLSSGSPVEKEERVATPV